MKENFNKSLIKTLINLCFQRIPLSKVQVDEHKLRIFLQNPVLMELLRGYLPLAVTTKMLM